MLSIPTGTKCAIAAYAGLAPDAGRIADSGLARIRASRYDQAPGSELGRGNLNRRPSTGIAVMVANVAMRTSRVVIVGAGFGGLSAARSLAGAPFDVVLIDRYNHHLFQPLLYQVAT